MSTERCGTCVFYKAHRQTFRPGYGRCTWQPAVSLPLAIIRIVRRAVKAREGKNCPAYISRESINHCFKFVSIDQREDQTEGGRDDASNDRC